MFLRLSCVLTMLSPIILAEPLLYSAPQVLSLVSSASAASSGSPGNGNIAKVAKLQDSLDDDDFFKDSPENQNVEMQNEASSNLLVNKINKIVQKVQFFKSLTAGGTTNDNDDDFQKEQDDFDKEFDEDFNKTDLKDGSGYVYNKPKKLQKSAKQEVESINKIKIIPESIGVFFMELVGSLVGLVYGAAAQLNYQGASTTAAPN